MKVRCLLVALAIVAAGCKDELDESPLKGWSYVINLPIDSGSAEDGAQLRTCDRVMHWPHGPRLEKGVARLVKQCQETVLPAMVDYWLAHLRDDTKAQTADEFCRYGYRALELAPDHARWEKLEAYCCHHPTVDDSQSCLGKDWYYDGKVHHIQY